MKILKNLINENTVKSIEEIIKIAKYNVAVDGSCLRVVVSIQRLYDLSNIIKSFAILKINCLKLYKVDSFVLDGVEKKNDSLELSFFKIGVSSIVSMIYGDKDEDEIKDQAILDAEKKLEKAEKILKQISLAQLEDGLFVGFATVDHKQLPLMYEIVLDFCKIKVAMLNMQKATVIWIGDLDFKAAYNDNRLKSFKAALFEMSKKNLIF